MSDTASAISVLKVKKNVLALNGNKIQNCMGRSEYQSTFPQATIKLIKRKGKQEISRNGNRFYIHSTSTTPIIPVLRAPGINIRCSVNATRFDFNLNSTVTYSSNSFITSFPGRDLYPIYLQLLTISHVYNLGFITTNCVLF